VEFGSGEEERPHPSRLQRKFFPPKPLTAGIEAIIMGWPEVVEKG
jgi:hypothetical protein